ncbi:MAG: hypothetical protein LC799_30400 [Actinobacteria bacterium]|nr:hypothetical protein [Actinomycetota bacterium]
MLESGESSIAYGHHVTLVLALWIAVAACGAGGGSDSGQSGPPLRESEARAAIVAELLAQPQGRTGVVRFAVHDSSTEIAGVADFDHQRYVSRLEVNRPDVVASYDVAVIDGVKYEKVLEVKSAAGSPPFKPRWSEGESWAPDKEGFPSVPYVPLPFVGEPGSDIRRDLAGFDEARRRQVIEGTIAGFSSHGPETRRGQPTMKYTVTFDRGRAEALLRDEVAQGLLSIAPASPTMIEVDVWIDGRGRLRAYKPRAGNSTREYEFWDYGKPSAVILPDDLTVKD